MSRKIESFERINLFRVKNWNFDSCNSCKRLGSFFCSCIRDLILFWSTRPIITTFGCSSDRSYFGELRTWFMGDKSVLQSRVNNCTTGFSATGFCCDGLWFVMSRGFLGVLRRLKYRPGLPCGPLRGRISNVMLPTPARCEVLRTSPAADGSQITAYTLYKVCRPTDSVHPTWPVPVGTVL